jgi:predicted ATPase
MLQCLGSIREPELVTPAIAQTLGIPESSGRSVAQNLYEYLHPKQMLLVLDNFRAY